MLKINNSTIQLELFDLVTEDQATIIAENLPVINDYLLQKSENPYFKRIIRNYQEIVENMLIEELKKTNNNDTTKSWREYLAK